jgi:hypothetical protein
MNTMLYANASEQALPYVLSALGDRIGGGGGLVL